MNDWLPHHGGFQKECPVCDGRFIGRKNKIYCSDACKARYHNDLHAQRRLEQARHTSSLMRNIEILKEALSYTTKETITIPMQTLLAKGFDSTAPAIRAMNGDVLNLIYGDFVVQVNEEDETVDVQAITKQ